MRVGKKPQSTIVENKKTRSCMVRLEKVRSSPGDSPDEKQLKGPLKKRPITQIASPTMTKPKEREKIKSTPKYEEELYETPPTIAAGRSRRAIKPNPKYASEDMVTPRIIKNVSVLGATGSNKKGSESGKMRKSSESSEDFFNKESADELDDLLMDEMDKGSDVDEKHFEDYDSSDMLIEETPKPRGRPRKNVYSQLTYSASSETTRTGAASKMTSQNQLVQLRKSMGSAMRPSPTQLMNLKRKMDSDDVGVTNKRFVYSSRLTKQTVAEKDGQRNNENQHTETRKPVSGQMPNGSKIIVSHESDDEELVATVSNNAVTGANSKSSAILQRRSPTTRLLANTLKQRSSSPTIRKLRESSTGARNLRSSPQSNAGDEADAMPTFTIVNINDIINKKGDVLISKSGEKAPVASTTIQERITRRKIGNNSASTERGEAPKKQTILNHTLLNKSAGNVAQTRLKVSSVSSAKPAPRILNSMVAKRMQLVKPKIANLDDSADETFSLSLDDDEEIEQEDAKAFANARKVSVFTKKTSPTKLATTAVAGNKVITTPVVNNNRLPIKVPPRKAPETVDISREGDRIIKKVTCFGTWYVVNPSSKRPVAIDRNVFDASLIELANRVEEIKLPSEQWSNKVTLYEMSPAILTKSSPTTVYTGDLSEHNIPEENRYKYQVSCVMFRRAVNTRYKSRLPYDRAVIFKNKTFFTNIEGKNVKLIAAPTTITSHEDIEILLEIVDSLTLQSSLVEPATTVQ